MSRWIFLIFLFINLNAMAQDILSLSGTVRDAATRQPLPYVSVAVKDQITGATTDARGNFQLKTKGKLPVVIVFSYVGYQRFEWEITALNDTLPENFNGLQNNPEQKGYVTVYELNPEGQTTPNDNENGERSGSKNRNIYSGGKVNVYLLPQPYVINEVVVTASRVEERILASPVSISQWDNRTIRQSPAPTFFESLQALKGVQMTTVSLGFKVPNTRGFANPTNVRFLQLVDGVDNQAPVIGASIANAVGPSELDIEKVEIIPGTASALYGMNALNGLAHFITKNPFDYQGFSVYQRTGVNHLNSSYSNARLISESAIRYAKAFNNRLAFKASFTYFRGHDWVANQTTDLNSRANSSVGLLGEHNPAPDPVSSYGNEGPNRRLLSMGGRNYMVARTGYYEKDITDYSLKNLKADASLHYRLSQSLEASYTFRFGRVDNVYQRTNRFKLDDYRVDQHILQVKSPVFQARVYMTNENSGKAYNIRSLAENLDRSFKPDDQWFQDYQEGFLNSVSSGTPVSDAHNIARQLADHGRFVPGNIQYDSAFRRIIAINDWDFGAALRTKATIYHTEGQYDFSSRLKHVNLLLGYDYRMFSVFPDGNYFINPVEEGNNLFYSKKGAFVQVSKKLIDEKLSLNATLRYDKNDYFRGTFNPRLAAVYSLTSDQFLRVSYQNGYRFPSLFEAFSNVNSGGVKRVGGVPVMSSGIFENSYIRSSIDSFVAEVNKQINQQEISLEEAIANNSHLIKKSTYTYLQPERINSWELGNKSLMFDSRLFIDLDFYFNTYNNFIAQVEVNKIKALDVPADSVPFYLYDRKKQDRYRLWTNSTSRVFNFGSSLSLSYHFLQDFYLSGNVSYARLHRTTHNDGLEEAFNTPAWITNFSFGNAELIRNLGFQLAWHWQSKFLWQSALGTGIVPSYSTFDAQASLKIPALKILLKAGGSNILNRYYHQMIAGPEIGALYYMAISFDELLR